MLKASRRGRSPAPSSSSTRSTASIAPSRSAAGSEPSTTCTIRSARRVSSSVAMNASTSWCGQLADEADRVGHQVVAALVPVRAGGRVERVEEPVPHSDLGARDRVQQGRLAGVGVAGQRHRRDARGVATGPHHRAVLSPGPSGGDAGPRSGRAPADGRSRSGTRPGPWCRCRRPCARRRGARGASTARACARGCIPAAPARPGACPPPCGHGRRRCRGSRRCGRSPVRRAPPRGSAPGGGPARRRWPPGWRSMRLISDFSSSTLPRPR